MIQKFQNIVKESFEKAVESVSRLRLAGCCGV